MVLAFLANKGSVHGSVHSVKIFEVQFVLEAQLKPMQISIFLIIAEQSFYNGIQNHSNVQFYFHKLPIHKERCLSIFCYKFAKHLRFYLKKSLLLTGAGKSVKCGFYNLTFE